MEVWELLKRIMPKFTRIIVSLLHVIYSSPIDLDLLLYSGIKGTVFLSIKSHL